MNKKDYKAKILEMVEDGPVTIEQIKYELGRNPKHPKGKGSINNLRKPLYRLLKDGLIEFAGYNSEKYPFTPDGLMIKKATLDHENPIYAWELLKNPLKKNNFEKLRELFYLRIENIKQSDYDWVNKKYDLIHFPSNELARDTFFIVWMNTNLKLLRDEKEDELWDMALALTANNEIYMMKFTVYLVGLNDHIGDLDAEYHNLL